MNSIPLARLLVGVWLVTCGVAHAQNWPNKPLRILVGSSPGGGIR